MNAEIITIGTELLLGHTIDTNASAIGRMLSELGIDLYRKITVGDNVKRLTAQIAESAQRSDFVITCGGLGPTVDDITFEAIAKAAGHDLTQSHVIKKHIDRFLKGRKKWTKDVPGIYKPAFIPRLSNLFPNSAGTAYGIAHKYASSIIIALPGPPSELIPMLKHEIKPYLARRVKQKSIVVSKSLKLFGIPEPVVNAKIISLLRAKGPLKTGIYAGGGEVVIRLMAKAPSKAAARNLMKPAIQATRKTFGDALFGTDEDTLEKVCLSLLQAKKMTLAIAESCTGGGLTEKLTSVPGASSVIRGGIAAYSNHVKRIQLCVSGKILKKHGAVSAQVACAMASSVQKILKTDIGLGITGIAGPDGGTRLKPVGCVYISLAYKKRCSYKKYLFRGSRQHIRLLSVRTAADILRRSLLLSHPPDDLIPRTRP